MPFRPEPGSPSKSLNPSSRASAPGPARWEGAPGSCFSLLRGPGSQTDFPSGESPRAKPSPASKPGSHRCRAGRSWPPIRCPARSVSRRVLPSDERSAAYESSSRRAPVLSGRPPRPPAPSRQRVVVMSTCLPAKYRRARAARHPHDEPPLARSVYCPEGFELPRLRRRKPDLAAVRAPRRPAADGCPAGRQGLFRLPQPIDQTDRERSGRVLPEGDRGAIP